MNIEKDIRAIRDGKTAVDPRRWKLLPRAAVLMDYAVHFPNDKAMVSKAKTDQWVKMSKDSLDLSKKLAEEAGKGRGPMRRKS